MVGDGMGRCHTTSPQTSHVDTAGPSRFTIRGLCALGAGRASRCARVSLHWRRRPRVSQPVIRVTVRRVGQDVGDSLHAEGTRCTCAPFLLFMEAELFRLSVTPLDKPRSG